MSRPEPRHHAHTMPDAERTVTVLAVDDHEAYREAIRDLVRATDGFTLVGEAASGEGALAAVSIFSPRLVILDVGMPGMSGIDVARCLADDHPEVVVVLVSVDEPDSELLRSCRAAAFISKRHLSPRLLREVWRDHGQLSP